MQVTVKLQPSVAAALRPGLQVPVVPASEVVTLQQAVDKLGIELRPMHPTINDPDLSTYFTAEVPDSDTERLQQVLHALWSFQGVEAAFVPAQAEPAG
jgi:hypothetical protein